MRLNLIKFGTVKSTNDIAIKIIRSKNHLINTINEKLEFQKKEIIDSINYAKR